MVNQYLTVLESKQSIIITTAIQNDSMVIRSLNRFINMNTKKDENITTNVSFFLFSVIILFLLIPLNINDKKKIANNITGTTPKLFIIYKYPLCVAIPKYDTWL